MKRGEIYLTDITPVLDPIKAIELINPDFVYKTLVVQNDNGCEVSPTIIVSPIAKDYMVTSSCLEINSECGKLMVMPEQLRTVDKRRLKKRVTIISEDEMAKVSDAICKAMELC